MSIAKSIDPTVLDTIIGHLTMFFLASVGSDIAAARHAAAQFLAAYHPDNEEELTLAAEIISLSLQAVRALAQATTPDLTPERAVLLNRSAVSLEREAHKSRRKLAQLQADRQLLEIVQAELADTPNQPAETAAEPAPVSKPIPSQPIAAHKMKFSSNAARKQYLLAQMTEKNRRNKALHAAAAANPPAQAAA